MNTADPLEDPIRGPLEWAIVRSASTLLVTLPPAALLLLIDHPNQHRLLTVVLVHLGAVTTAGLFLTSVLLPRTTDTWFTGLPPLRDRWATAAAAVALVTGMVALTTLASSAALRYDPSLQFLQLLSAVDIAWVTSATTLGVAWGYGRRAGLVAGGLMAAVCVWSIWSYLDAVGFGPGGEWLVDGAALRRHVLPYDVAAASIALTSVAVGAQRANRRPGASI